MQRALLTSLTRITGIGPNQLSATIPLGEDFSARPVPREAWAAGDYVVGRIQEGSPVAAPIELPSGRMVKVGEADLVIGAFGRRSATLEVVGDWRAIGEDGNFEALTSAGLFGHMTSRSEHAPELLQLAYEGHFHVEGRPTRMADFVPKPTPCNLQIPVVLIVGSSMSAGKTTTGRAIVRALRRAGRRVVAAKITGAGRYRDVLSLGDAGAEWIFDFVDAGLPSTVCDPEEYRAALRGLLSHMGAVPAEVAVIEAGASPLEPYNGAVAVEMLAPLICFTVLCASDPYSVVGITQAFRRKPDLIAGVTTSTEAGVALVERLTGIPAMDCRSPRAVDFLARMLQERLSQRSFKREGAHT